MKLLKKSAALLLVLMGPITVSAHAQLEEGYHSQASLVSEAASISPGKPFTVALRISMDREWHIYWSNPGESGLATRLNWSLPAGFKASNLRWAYPKRFGAAPLVMYGYEEEVWLLTDITPPSDLPLGKPVSLRANAQWLVCNESCIPVATDLLLTLPVDSRPAVNPKFESEFTAARKRLPIPPSYASYTVQAERASASTKSKLVLRFAPRTANDFTDGELSQLYFYSTEPYTIAASKPQKVTRNGNGFQIELSPDDNLAAPIKRLRGVLVAPEGKTWGAGAGVKSIIIDAPLPPATTKTSGGAPKAKKPNR